MEIHERLKALQEARHDRTKAKRLLQILQSISRLYSRTTQGPELAEKLTEGRFQGSTVDCTK